MALTNLLTKTAAALAQAEIPYLIIGGQAVLLYGEVRFTQDADVIIALPTSQANLVLTALEHLNPTCPTSTPVEFVKQNTVLPLINPESGARIKLIFSTSPFEQRAIERANVVKVGNTPVNFAALNDLIIYKVIAGRARDFDDIRSIARKNLPALDIAYIKNGWHCFKKKVENRLPASSPIYVTNLESILKKSNRLRGELITQFRFQPGQ